MVLNVYGTENKDKNKPVWIDLRKTPQYQAETKERYRIQRRFREPKTNRGLRRFRYTGRMRCAIQAYLRAMAPNVKRVVKLLTGVSCKVRAKVMP